MALSTARRSGRAVLHIRPRTSLNLAGAHRLLARSGDRAVAFTIRLRSDLLELHAIPHGRRKAARRRFETEIPRATRSLRARRSNSSFVNSWSAPNGTMTTAIRTR